MAKGQEDHTEEYNNTIFAFNVVLTAIVTSLGIFGNSLVLLLLRNWNDPFGKIGNLKIVLKYRKTLIKRILD